MTYRIGKTEDCDYPGLGELLNAGVLHGGDLVELLNTHTYTGSQKWFYPDVGSVEPITFRGINDANGKRPLFDGRGKMLESPRAFFELYGSSGEPGDGAWVIENIEFSYGRNNDDDMNASAMRNVNAASATMRSCKVWNCASGVMSSEDSGETIIEDTDIGFCGYGDGHSHDIYCMGQKFRLLNSRIHDSIVGQNVKTRSRFVEISHNEIFFSRDGEIGIIQSGDGTPEDSWLTAQPGSNALVLDNEITTRKDRSGGNQGMVVSFGFDMGTCGRNGTLYFHGNKVICQNANNVVFMLTGSTTSLDVLHNKFIGEAKYLIDERQPAVEITGKFNWTDDSMMDQPAQFTNPVEYLYYMGVDYSYAWPAKRHLNTVVGTPTNLRDWTGDQGGLAIEWDPVPGAAMYRVWREKIVNGDAVEKTIWGGATEPRYVDTFQHYASTSSKKMQYAYRIVAVDMNGNQSDQSAQWIKEHGTPGYAGLAARAE